MMAWEPNIVERPYVEIIASMACDTLAGSGVETRDTFVSNLRLIADQMERIPNVADKKEGV